MYRNQAALILVLSIVVSTAFAFSLLVHFSTIKSVFASGPWYVTPGGNDSNTCLSPATPCATINAAINKASLGDTVYISTGTYTSDGGNAVVILANNVTLSGGWNVSFTSQTGTSVIDGQGARIGIFIDSGSAEINHFTIQNGFTDFNGGGIYVQSSNLNIANSRILSNSANIGGGILDWSGVITITNTVIEKNVADIGGGGIYNINGLLTITDSTISGNTIGLSTINPSGAAIWSSDPGSRTVLNRTTIRNNHSRTAQNLWVID